MTLSNRAGYKHTGDNRKLIPSAEADDEAVPVGQNRDAWVRRSGYAPVFLPAGANVCTAGRSAAGGEPPVTLGRRA